MLAIWRRAVAPVVRGAHNFLDWRGLAWLIEVRGLANRSEGLANRSEGLGAGLAGPVDKSEGFLFNCEGLGGRAGPGPVDKSEGLGGRPGPGPCR